MSSGPDADQASNIQLLDRFYGMFLAVGLVFLTVGVPFVFYRKAASAVACVILIGLVVAAWRMSRKGKPQKSLMLFAGGLWLILVALIFGGLPPITTATMLAIAVMLSVVVSIRAGAIYSGAYMLAWLVYVVSSMLGMAPEPYFVGKPIVSWFIGLLSIWLVLLPIPILITRCGWRSRCSEPHWRRRPMEFWSSTTRGAWSPTTRSLPVFGEFRQTSWLRETTRH
ncbi:MAG: hypothetical protein NT042_09065 [Sulfuritalea sp.]|nr:hypothetical protein [Sulfuritalea sp.]